MAAAPFTNQPLLPPLFKRTAYKQLVFVLFVVSLVTFSADPTAAALMLIAVIVSVLASYSSMNSQRGSTPRGTQGGLSNLMVGTQGSAVVVYLFFLTRAANAQFASPSPSF